MAKIKISQLPAKAANLAATDLLEVSEVSGLTYVSKKITGAELVGNRVPYTGATSDVDLGEYELKAGQIELDQSPTGTAGVAVTRWNDSIGLTETTLKGGSVIIKNGVDLVARVVNKVSPNTTLTKAAYPVVKISGAQGQRLAVDYAQANNDNNSADTLGVVTETIATNQEGFIMTVGQLEGINTTGSLQGETWLDGDVLYLSPTVPGAVTKVKPTGATGHIVVIGYVEHAHNVNGKIYVKIMNGWELDELHNVYINQATLANNDALIYESSTQLWKNNPVTESVLSLSDVTTNNVSITKHGFAPKLPNDASKFLDGTGNYTSPPTGLTVGTTPVTSGTNGRVFFQAGGVVQQSQQFTFEEASNAGILRVRESGNIIYDLDARTSAVFNKPIDVSGNSIFRITTGGGGSVTFRDNVTATSNTNIVTTSTGVIMDFNGGGVRRVRIDSRSSEPALQVRAADGLSNAAFRVMNSTGTYNLIESRGDGHLIVSNSNFADVFTAQNSLESFRVGGGNLNYVRTTQSGNLTFVIRNGASSNALITLNAGSGNSVFWENLFGFDTTTKNLTVFGGSAIAGGNSGNSVMWVRSGTSTPSASFADMFGIYSADITAGNAAPHFRTENGDIIKLYKNTAVTTPQGIADALTNLGVLTASTIAPSVQSVVSAATVTPVNGNDLVKITAQAEALTLANPTGVWPEGKDLMIRIKDDGLGARTITRDTNYRAIGVTLPTTTVLGKTTYVGVIYNSTDGIWDVIGVTTQA